MERLSVKITKSDMMLGMFSFFVVLATGLAHFHQVGIL